MAALQPRQVRLYRSQVTIWRQDEDIAGDGEPGALAWSEVATEVPCYADLGKSQHGPNGPLLVENDNLFTFDEFHFVYDVDLIVGDVVKLTMFNRATTGPNIGRYWTARGDPQTKNFLANKLIILLSRTPTPPTGVS